MIAAIVLAAGLSRRMGQPKLVMPWQDTTVIGQVVRVLDQAGMGDIVVVSGGAHAELQTALSSTQARIVYNPRYAEDQMMLSLQIGLAALPGEAEAAMLALGDQPQIELEVVKAVLTCFLETRSALVAPSYQMRRGHPIVIDRSLWPALLALQLPATLRDYLNTHPDQVHYLNVERESILRDLDTPEDYQREHPGAR